jgi:hypothetical protein
MHLHAWKALNKVRGYVEAEPACIFVLMAAVGWVPH